MSANHSGQRDVIVKAERTLIPSSPSFDSPDLTWSSISRRMSVIRGSKISFNSFLSQMSEKNYPQDQYVKKDIHDDIPFHCPAVCTDILIFVILEVCHGEADQVFFLRVTIEPPLNVSVERFHSHPVPLRLAKLNKLVEADESLDSVAETLVQSKGSRHGSCPFLSAHHRQ